MGLVFGALRVSLCTQPRVPSCHHGRRRCHSRSPAWPLPHCGGEKKSSWNGLGKLPVLPKRRDPQHPHPSLQIPLPVCGISPHVPAPQKRFSSLAFHVISLFHHETNPNQVNSVLSRRRRQSLCGPGNSPDFISFLSKGLFGIRPCREGGVA